MNSLDFAKQDLLSAGIILLTGLVGLVVAKKLKIPDIVVFLLTGIILGPYTGLLHVPAEGTMNQIILTFGASYLLFDGGATLRFTVLRRIWITIVVLSTIGVLLTGAVVLGTGIVVGLPVMTALLLGATIASTDPATLVPIFKQVKIRDRVAQAVMSESAFNDAMGAIATFTVLGIALAGPHATFSVTDALKNLLWEAGLGIIVGAAAGFLVNFLIAHEKFGFFREYLPLVTIMAVIAAYLSADGANSSGFMAVFVFGIIIGNKESFGFKLNPGEQDNMQDFVDTTSLIVRMFIFILLGSQVNFTLLAQYAVPGLIILGVFLFFARPLTVFACALPDRRAKWTLPELLFMSWTRETGVIPAALAGMMLGLKVPGAEVVLALTFIAVLGSILIQATTIRIFAKRLGLLEKEENEFT